MFSSNRFLISWHLINLTIIKLNWLAKTAWALAHYTSSQLRSYLWSKNISWTICIKNSLCLIKHHLCLQFYLSESMMKNWDSVSITESWMSFQKKINIHYFWLMRLCNVWAMQRSLLKLTFIKYFIIFKYIQILKIWLSFKSDTAHTSIRCCHLISSIVLQYFSTI